MKPFAPKFPLFGIPALSEDMDASTRPSRRRDVTYVPLMPPEKGPSEDDRDPPSVG